MAPRPPTMPERMQHLETLIEDPELGLIAHVRRVEQKTDEGLRAANEKLDTLLEERATRRPILATAKYAGTAFVGAVMFWLANLLLPASSLKPPHHP